MMKKPLAELNSRYMGLSKYLPGWFKAPGTFIRVKVFKLTVGSAENAELDTLVANMSREMSPGN